MWDSFPARKYSILYMDPPWSYNVKGGRGAADKHYGVVSLETLKTLPIQQISKPDCLLFMWATWPLITEALELGAAYGFSYRSAAFVWVKLTSKGNPFIGMGHWTRANTEPCLLFIKGKPKRESAPISQVILSERMKHSQKPDEARQRIVQLCGSKSRIELFARQKVKGWHVWGNEV